MDLSSYVGRLRHELGVVAEAGGDDARVLAERLTAPLESAVRLVLLEALSDAADEITRELAPGSVEVRLRGRMPGFVVIPALRDDHGDEEPNAPAAGLGTTASGEVDDGPTTRINLRLPDALKARVETAAVREHLSINAWLVRAAAAALAPDRAAPDRSGARGRRGQSFTGWIR